MSDIRLKTTAFCTEDMPTITAVMFPISYGELLLALGTSLAGHILDPVVRPAAVFSRLPAPDPAYPVSYVQRTVVSIILVGKNK